MAILKKVKIYNSNLNIEMEYDVPEDVASYIEDLENDCVELDQEADELAMRLEYTKLIILN